VKVKSEISTVPCGRDLRGVELLA